HAALPISAEHRAARPARVRVLFPRRPARAALHHRAHAAVSDREGFTYETSPDTSTSSTFTIQCLRQWSQRITARVSSPPVPEDSWVGGRRHRGQVTVNV